MARPIHALVLASASLLVASNAAAQPTEAAPAGGTAPPRSDAPPATAAPESNPRNWGDWSIALVERFGQLMISGADHGTSGLIRGSGIDARYMMPMGWGAYWRVTTGATGNDDRFDWLQTDVTAGVSRRLLRVGRDAAWTPRAQARLDVGVGYTQIGTNETCSQSFVPFGTSCSTGAGRPQNVQGNAFSLEGRLAAEVAFGPIGLGVDVGVAGHLTFSTGPNSLTPPTWFFLPSGQLRLGIALPFT